VTLTPPPCDALIFDCDGTLADTFSVHFSVISQVLARRGIDFEESWYAGHVALSAAELLDAIHRHWNVRVELGDFETARVPLYDRALEHVREIAPVVAVARFQYGKRPLAVASGGPRAVVERTLRNLGIYELFDTVVTIDDVARGKPAPDLFELAAKRLRVDAGRCVVYEDTDEGLLAARIAGMIPIDVRPALVPRIARKTSR
jgi:beta-phosphoglucomutase-like phosphatase (HAD superfamily)